jgi:hypothetical protein
VSRRLVIDQLNQAEFPKRPKKKNCSPKARISESVGRSMPATLTMRISMVTMKLIFGFPRPAWIGAVFLVLAWSQTLHSQQWQNARVDRTILPLQEPDHPPITEIDVRKAMPPPRFEVNAPEGAPNVIVILLDNLGFGATSTFGGVINMPTLERLARNGLVYNNFHTAPLCSPSRAALLTGRNPHSVNMGSVAELATAFPGQTSERPNSKAPLAEVMKLNTWTTSSTRRR